MRKRCGLSCHRSNGHRKVRSLVHGVKCDYSVQRIVTNTNNLTAYDAITEDSIFSENILMFTLCTNLMLKVLFLLQPKHWFPFLQYICKIVCKWSLPSPSVFRSSSNSFLTCELALRFLCEKKSVLCWNNGGSFLTIARVLFARLDGDVLVLLLNGQVCSCSIVSVATSGATPNVFPLDLVFFHFI